VRRFEHCIIAAGPHRLGRPRPRDSDELVSASDFTFENAVRFWGEVNPDFFKGTVVETAAAEVLARTGRRV